MTIAIIITFCSLLLIAYLFDLTSSITRIPSVILLLLLGWGARQSTDFLGISLPDFTAALPILGTIGLILIVLEGSLELELKKSKIGLIRKSFFGALLPMFAMAFLLAGAFQYLGNYSLKDSLINAIPFSIISSTIAISSVKNLALQDRAFVIYESSFSDIIGILFFNFMVFNNSFELYSFGNFGIQLMVIAVVSFVATITLSLFLSKIDHHIKFVPIILLVILIYAVSEIYQLPALIFILVFGLFIGNLDELNRFRWIEKFKPSELNSEVKKFKELTIEGAFLVRALFFLLFGFLLETTEILNTKTLTWSVAIVFIIIFFRTIQLKLSRLPLTPLLFIAPRGLISILLFLSIAPGHMVMWVNKSLIIQVILLSSIIMMFGLMVTARNDNNLAANK